MKLGLKFGDNAANIAGHRVPYSLLGAAAAILGAFLIWKFNQNGGLNLGQQSPDLEGLGAGSDLGSFGDLNNLVNTLPSAPKVYPTSPPIPSYSYPITAYTDYSGTVVDSPAAVGAGSTSYSGGGDNPVNLLQQIVKAATKHQPAPKPPSGGTNVGLDPGGYVAPKPAAKPAPAPTGGGGGGNFAP